MDVKRGKERGEELGGWDWHLHNIGIIYKMDS